MSAKKAPDESEVMRFAMQLYLNTDGKKVKRILKRIKERFGEKISRAQFNDWCETEGWKRMLSEGRERSREMELEDKSFKQIMFDALKDRKEAYERYFRTISADKMDNNAHWAYKDILTKLEGLLEEMKQEEEKTLSKSEKQFKDGKSMGELFGFNY